MSKIISKMKDRVDADQNVSDTDCFNALLLYGEMLVKLIAIGLNASIKEEQDRHKYRHLYSLVRADSVGAWAQVIDETLTGPAAQFVLDSAREAHRELTQKVSKGTWQYAATKSIHNVVSVINPKLDELQVKISLQTWIHLFVELRNSTRGHGALRPFDVSKLCPALKDAIDIIVNNYSMFKKDWAYIKRALSGKYQVVAIGEAAHSFDYLKSNKTTSLEDGVYVFFEKPVLLDLIKSDVVLSDFYFPNGNFSDKGFEMLSYLSGAKLFVSSLKYMSPPTSLPESETQGAKLLDVKGEVFTNMPEPAARYISRPELENEFKARILDENHSIITLVGGGGIGKTSLAISVLHEICYKKRFEEIFWFSARDIDLLPEGPKLVRPNVLTINDIAGEYVKLNGKTNLKPQERLDCFAQALQKRADKRVGTLFVFDNFETIQNPLELFVFIDTHIRPPNKVVITTRTRDFKGDYPIEVRGMEAGEAYDLMENVANYLGVKAIITEEYKKEIYEESGGHPYVIKLFIGEVAKYGKRVDVNRIVAAKDEMLDALFERTYTNLSPAARRVLFTLSSWNSVMPQIAVEAFLMKPSGEGTINVSDAIEELKKSSLIEINEDPKEKQPIISLPLAANIFTQKKLAISPMRIAVEADRDILMSLGASQESAGLEKRLRRMFKKVAEDIDDSEEKLVEYRPKLEYMARRFPPAWLVLAELYEESNLPNNLSLAEKAIQRLLEGGSSDELILIGWNKLAEIAFKKGDCFEELHARVEMCQLPGVVFETISNTANRMNSLFHHGSLSLDTDEKKVLIEKLVSIMEGKILEGNATDYSRLAWLSMHLKDETKALKYAKKGLDMDKFNEHCSKLVERINTHRMASNSWGQSI